MKMTLRTLLIAVCLLALAIAPCAALAEEEVPADGVALTRLMGNGINLGNTFEACNNGMSGGNTTDDVSFYETMWGQPVTTREMITAMKEAGFDSIRIPVAWMTNATHLGKGVGDYTISPAYLSRVEEVVGWAIDAGMIVVLNDHWDGGWYGMFGSDSPETRALAMEAYRGMWTQIAQHFAAYDWHLVFEGANEEIGARFDENAPLYCQDSTDHYLSDAEKYRLANEVNQAFVDTVRAAGGNNADRFLLIPGYGTNIERTFDSRFAMPKDTVKGRLLVSVHCYSPWSYCGATSAKSATRWGTKANYEELDREMKMMARFVGQGIGVIIGEYGVLPGNNGELKDNAVSYHRYFLDLCDCYDYCPMLWDCSGYFIRRSLSFSDPEMGKLYGERRLANEDPDRAQVKAAAQTAMAEAAEAAPETFREDVAEITDETIVAWIMWSSGDWALSYSVGDTYTPDSISAGIVPTDVVIDGEGTYTVALDFTGTEKGFSGGVAFSAIGLSNAEVLHPGWAVHVQEVKINGEPYKLSGRPYTTSDDGKCTRVNLFNEWVTGFPADARVLYGPNIGISATVLNRDDAVIGHVETIEVTFIYGPKK